ncbi:MAG: hypothetical protein GY704_01740, partial [Phycisphaeraceae bacterium]|nr:hypothetical protein [Phycisphaeraceae bacterium]
WVGDGEHGLLRLDSDGFREQDGELSAEFGMTVPGGVIIENEPAAYMDGFYLPGSYRSDDADIVTVVAGAETRYDAVRPLPVTISGTCLGVWDQFGFRSPEIAVQAVGGNGIMEVSSDPFGAFTVVLPAAGDFVLRTAVVDEDGDTRGPASWIGGDSFAEAQVVSLRAGEDFTGLQATNGGLRLDLAGDEEMTEVYLEA